MSNDEFLSPRIARIFAYIFSEEMFFPFFYVWIRVIRGDNNVCKRKTYYNETLRKTFRPVQRTGASVPIVRHRARLRREPIPHAENQRDAVDGGDSVIFCTFAALKLYPL
jgi:hypothetical protein